MEKKKLIIYGVGRFAEYVQYVFEQDSSYIVEAFCIESKLMDLQTWKSKIPLISLEVFLKEYSVENYFVFVAVGNNNIRKHFFLLFKENGFSLANYISTQCSSWPNLRLGENIFIDEGCVLQPFIEIGDNSILFTSQIGHHTHIGKHSLISGAKTGGNVKIGDNCYVGLNASIKQNISVADNSIVGMGCIIEKDTDLNEVYTHKGTVKRKIDATQISSRFLR
ncbi:acetyltransferase [Salinimicrobium sp. MT39]|uniref:Acetyltransferase n=1 Tax=Salinimicrobium profundisediminis TaxID=2994553 RepID=A0A9X3CYV8_9FLAO|nr:acetyltransferase [Salinimicrobium profundisediminis]MCX2837900.1 acetyltransferase [Salinimicrobium profundisediminis]